MTQQKPTIGLTGATGFIGGFILSELLNQEYTISVLIRDRKKFEGQIGNKISKVCILTGSLEDKNALKKLCKGSEIIIHCAAKVGDWGAPEEYERTNIHGTHELLKNCLIHKIQQFIYMSSMAVYGLGNFSNIQEDQPILPAKDPYNNSKAQTELLVQDFCKKNKLNFTIIRPGYVYGEGDTQIMPRVISGLQSKQFKFIGKGKNIPNFTYIKNLWALVQKAIGNKECFNQIYHLCDPNIGSVKQFIVMVANELDLTIPTKHAPLIPAKTAALFTEKLYRVFRIKRPPFLTKKKIYFLSAHRTANTTKAETLLGTIPYSYEEGVSKTLCWFKEKIKKEQK